MDHRVVITGAGCVTPLGNKPGELWQALTEARSGVGPITVFDATTFPVRIAAEVSDWDIHAEIENSEQWERHARHTQFAIVAAENAKASAGLNDQSVEPLRAGVSMGCGEIFPDFVRFAQLMGNSLHGKEFSSTEYIRECLQLAQADDELTSDPGVAAGCMAGVLNAQGPNTNFTTACVSSSVALGEAAEVIRRGGAEVMYAGGAHSMIHPFGISGFYRLSTLSTRNDEPQLASRPFDADRQGFVVGEGGVVIVLEELEHALRRGAEIWGELTGYGATDDAFRITDPSPDGDPSARCMELAMRDARLNPEEIDYVNAHGSGTVVNDNMETRAIKTAFGNYAYRLPVSSTKSMTGHLTTACGALEFLVCAKAIKTGVIPPTINYETADPDCDLDYVPNEARDIACQHVLSNSLGFGGQNVSLIVSKFDL